MVASSRDHAASATHSDAAYTHLIVNEGHGEILLYNRRTLALAQRLKHPGQ